MVFVPNRKPADPSLEDAIRFRLRDVREMRGLTQKDLAAKISYSASSIAFWEGGDRRMDFQAIIELAAALEVDITELVPGGSRWQACDRCQGTGYVRKDK